MIRDAYTVLWPELRFLSRRWRRILLTSLLSPLLYLLAFGYGLGRGIYIGGTSYLEFVIPGIIALTAMTSSFNGAGTKLNVGRLYYKTFDEYLMSPISLFSLVVGKALVGVVRGFISSAAFLIVASIASPGLEISPLFLLVLVLTCFVFAFLGVLAALLAKSHEDMATFSSLVLLPMTFLSGTFFSLNQLPPVVRALLYVLPLTHSSKCLRAAALAQPFPWWSLLALAIYAAAFCVACVQVARRSSV